MIYLDHAATTPLRPEVEAALESAGREGFANPSSQHAAGRRARQILEDARERILAALGSRSTGPDRHRLVFTSGATEANRLAVLGMVPSPTGAVAVSARDHGSVLSAANTLSLRPGWSDVQLPLDIHGALAPDPVADWLERTQDRQCRVLCTTLVCGQTGTLEPFLLDATEKHRTFHVHVDATQAVACLGIDVAHLGVATMTLAPHKFGGPRGIGGLVIRGDVTLEPLHPGPQETGMRGGTEPVALAAGFATAIELACEERGALARRLAALRERFEAGVLAAANRQGIAATIVGAAAARSPHVSTIGFHGRDRQAIVMAADLAGLSCATGTACASGSSEPAPALAAMGLPAEVAQGAVRFSFGRSTTADDIDRAITILETVLA